MTEYNHIITVVQTKIQQNLSVLVRVTEGSWVAPPYDENTGEIFVTEQEQGD